MEPLTEEKMRARGEGMAMNQMATPHGGHTLCNTLLSALAHMSVSSVKS